MDRKPTTEARPVDRASAPSPASPTANASGSAVNPRQTSRHLASDVAENSNHKPGGAMTLSPRLQTARWLAAVSGLVLAGFVGGEVRAVEAPSDPEAKAAFDVLEKHCSRCHQED